MVAAWRGRPEGAIGEVLRKLAALEARLGAGAAVQGQPHAGEGDGTAAGGVRELVQGGGG